MLCRLVEGGCHHLRLDAALHVGNFFGAFVYEEDDFVNLGMVVCDGVGDALEQHCLTGLGLGHYKTSLALAYGREHIYDTAARIGGVAMAEQVELLVREKGGEEVERHAVADELRRPAVYELDLDEREVLVTLARGADFAGDGVAGLEGVELYLLLRDVDVVGGVKVVVV